MATPAAAPVADPFPASYQRIAAASGILFAIALIVTIALTGATTPEHDAAVEEWTKYATDQEDSARIGALVMVFGLYWLIWFAGYLRSVLGTAEQAARGFARISNVAFAGALLGGLGLTFGVLINATSLVYEDANPEIIRGLNMVAGTGFVASSAGFAAMLFAAAIVNSRVFALPKWLTIVAYIGGVAYLLQNFTLLTEEGDNLFGIFYPIGFLALTIFAVAGSVGFLRGIGRSQGSV